VSVGRRTYLNASPPNIKGIRLSREKKLFF